MAPRTKQVTQRVRLYRYVCTRKCQYQGRRWWPGTEYEFNQKLVGAMAASFEYVDSKVFQEQPVEGLAYSPVGRELSRPSDQ